MASLNNLNQFPVENVSMHLNSFQLIVLVVGLVQFLLVHIVLERKRISNFFLGFQAAVRSHLLRPTYGFRDDSLPLIKEAIKRSDPSLCRGDMELVLKRLGMFEGTAKLPETLDSDHIFNLFEEKNPSLDEVKEAFEVFDENDDGFIDANELQNVLTALGLKEGSSVENCRRMIGVFDENGDGRIDFNEFVKFMESSLC